MEDRKIAKVMKLDLLKDKIEHVLWLCPYETADQKTLSNFSHNLRGEN